MPFADLFRRGSRKNPKKPGQNDQSASAAAGGETSSKPAVKLLEENQREEVSGVEKVTDIGKSHPLKKDVTIAIPPSLKEDEDSSVADGRNGQVSIKQKNSNEKLDTQEAKIIPLLDAARTSGKFSAGNDVNDSESKISNEVTVNITTQSEMKKASEVNQELEKPEDGINNMNTEEQKADFSEKKNLKTNESTDAQEKIESTQEKIESIQKQIENEQENIENTQEKVESTQEKVESTQEKIENAQENIESRQEMIESTQEQIENAKENIESIQEMFESTQEQIENAQKNIESTQGNIENAQEEIESTQENIENVQDKTESAQGNTDSAHVNNDIAQEKTETVTQSIAVQEAVITNEAMGYTKVPSRDESQLAEILLQVSAKTEDCLPGNVSSIDSAKLDAEAETHSDVGKQLESTNCTTKAVSLECDTNSNILDNESDVESSEKVSSAETEAQHPVNEMVSNDITVVQSHDDISKPVEEDTIKWNSSDTVEIILALRENAKSRQEDIEEKSLEVKNTIEKITEMEDSYVQLHLDSFESQSATPEIDTVQIDTKDILSEYSDLSEKIVSESLAEAFEELNLMFFETNETSDAAGDNGGNESSDENNDEGGNKNNDEGNNDNHNEGGDENNNEGGDENNNEDENQIENNERVILRKQDSGVASTDSEDMIDGMVLPRQKLENNSTQKWKVGYLQVKLPSKSRGKTKLKAWQKRWVVIQNDEFTRDERNCFLMISIYHSESGNSRRHSALFWRSLSSKKAVVYRSMSRTHPYAFTVADETGPLLHLASNSETDSQEWMTAIRSILWPPNPVLQLEKVLNGNEFDISFVDNEFSHRAGLLGTYGCLMVTNRKLILNHPHTGHVIQEWYLNTVDKFHIVPQPKEEDTNKVLVMHTSSDSSTGAGELRIFCNDAVAFLKSLASTIHKVLQYHSRGNIGRYDKELEELAEWLTPQPPQSGTEGEDYYKVPKRQVRSLLDIPNFIFDKPICETTISYDLLPTSTSPSLTPTLTTSYTSISTISQDSGILTATSSSDFLNCSQTSFSIGHSEIRRQGKRYQSSSSESSDGYSPPYSPITVKRPSKEENIAKLQESNHENS